MNEVRTVQAVAGLNATRSASSTGAVDAKGKSADGGNSLPENTEVKDTQALKKAQEGSQGQSPEVVETALAQMNDYVQSIQRDLQFTVDDETEKTVVKVVDGSSGELIRQIPEEVFLELARKLNEDGELRLMNALG
ncbi:MAG: flagellar protein FlaG [Agarilytica sp.]